MESLFELKHENGDLFLMYDGEAIDRFELLAIAKLRLNHAQRIENEIVQKCSDDCPAEIYELTFNARSRMEALTEIKAKQDRRNEKINRRTEARRNNRDRLRYRKNPVSFG